MKQNGSNNNTHEDDNGYKEMNSTPWPLKIHKDSHTIKKSSSSSITSTPGSMSSVGTTMGPKPSQQRAPLIIYTHSPKTIHTNPKDFMSLVQKLTGMSPSEQPTDHNVSSGYKKVRTSESHIKDRNPCENHKYESVVKTKTLSNNSNNSSDDNDSSSVITEENCSNSNVGDVVNGRLSTYVGTQFFDPTPSSQLLPNLPLCNLPNSTSDLLSCSGDLPLYDYMDFNFPL